MYRILGSMPNNDNILDAEVVVLLKYLTHFCRSLDLPLINSVIELNLRWSKSFAISEISRTFRAAGDPLVQLVVTATTGGTFQINNTKLYVPVVSLSINDNIIFLGNTKQGFKTTISRNKYRSEIITQQKNNNLDYLIDPTFRSINRLFVVSFKNVDNDPTKYSVDECSSH